MTKKSDQATALAGILKARRGDETPPAPAAPEMTAAEPEALLPPSPALPPTPSRLPSPKAETRAESRRRGKNSDPNYRQHSIYLRKDTHKRVKRRLEDMESDQDVSELVQVLLEQWLKSGT